MKIQKLIIKMLMVGLFLLLPLMQFGQTTCDEFVLEVLSDITVEVMRGERAYWTVNVRALVDEYNGVVRLRAYRPEGCLATWTPPNGELTPTIRQFGSVLELRTNGATPGTHTFNLAAIDEAAQIKSEVRVTLVVLEEDFEIDVTPPERQVCQGESTSYNVDLTPLNGFDSQVTLAVTGLPGGAQGTFTPNPVNPDGSSTLNITTTNSVPFGTYTLTITGTGGEKVHSRTVTFIVDNANCEDFEINVTPPERQVCQGDATSYTVNITGVMGFSSPVTLSVSGLPSGAQGTFTVNPVNPGNQSTLNITTTNSVPLGTYTLTITGTGGEKVHSRTVTFIVDNENCEDFEINVTPPEQRICQGDATSYTVNITGIMGFSSPVTLSVSGLPGGAQGTFTVNPVTPGNQSTLNITTTNSVSLGTYTLTITGTGGEKVHSRNVTFIVDNENCEDFEINVTPPERQVCQGDATSYTVNITGLMGFDSPVTLSVSGLPGGAQGTFTVNPLNAGNQSVLNITTTASVPIGNYILTITGSGGGREHSRTVTFIVDNENCEDFEINVTPPEQRICQGDATSYTVNITGIMGVSSPVTLSVSGLPGGAQGTFSVNPVNPDGSSTLNITTTDSVPLGTYTLTITGSGGGKEHSRTVSFIVDNENCEDFEIDVTPGRLVLCRGESNSYTVNITGLRGFNSPVNLSVAGLPSGVTHTFTPGSVTPDGQSVLTVTASASAATGTFNLTVTGVGGGKEHSVQVTLRVRNCDEPDFDIDINPPELTVTCGEEADYDVTLSSINGFNSPVTLTVTGLPDGSTATFSPDSVTPDGHCQLKITTGPSVSGVYSLTVTGSGGGKEASVHVTLIIICETPDPSYQLDVTPNSRQVCRGLSASYNVNLTSLEGFNSPVTLSVSGLPTGAVGTFSENPVTPTGSSVLEIATSDETPFGTYTLTIQGDSGGLIKEDTVTLTIIDSRFSVQIEANPITGTVPLTVNFQALITQQGEFPLSQYTFHWDFGDGGTAVEQNPDHTYENPGRYNVTLDVTGPCGQGETASLEIFATSEGGRITKTFSQSEVQPGDEVTMTITAINNTNFHFENVVIRDTLSQYLEYLEDDASVEPIRSGRELKWKFARLRSGESLTINVKLRVSLETPPGKIVNIAYLSYDNLSKEIPSNPAELIVYKIEVLLEKSVDKTIANPGEHIKYQLRLTNNSSVPLTNIKLTDVLPSHLEYIAQSGALDFSIEGQNIQYTGTLDPGQTVEIAIEAMVKSDTLGGTVIENCAAVQADQLREEVKSNCVITTVPDQPGPPITVRFIKRADVPQSGVGRIVGFTLTIINESDYTLKTPTIEDYFPQGFNYVPGSTLLNGQPFDDPQGKRRVVWQLPDIKARETVIMRYQVVIGADVRRGTNINRAWLQSGDLLLEASDIVNISGPGIIFYCGLEGFVYLDLDCNGVFNYGDTPLEGIEVRLSSGEKAVTDKFGHYIFEDLYPGDYVVSINPNSLPDMYVITGESPTLVVLSEGLTDNVNFGLKYKDGNAVGGIASLELEAVCPEAVEASKLKGQPFTLKFIIRNTGEVDLYNVVIKDTLPQYFQYVPGSSRLDDSTIDEPQGVPGPSLEWQIGTLGKGQSKTFLFQAAADIDIKATIYKNQAFAEAVIACAEITTDIQECKLAIYEGPGCCPQVEEAAVGSFAKPEAPLSFIEPYFHTETAMFTVYAVFKLWNGQTLQKDGMPLFMKERLQNYARSTVEEFYLNSRMGINLPDGSIRLSFAGAYPEKDPETKERKWLRKNVDETMTVSQIAWELLGLNETVKEEKRADVKSRLETIIKEKLGFLEEFINDIDNMPHGWEITPQAKEHGKTEEDASYTLKRLREKASPYDKTSLYLAMAELSRGGYNRAEGFAAKIRASLAADKIDDKSFVWSHRHAEFMFILALLENGQKDTAADKIKAFEELLKQGLQLNDLHTYALAAAVDKKAGGTLYEGIAAKMKKKFYLQDTGIFADNQPDFTFKVSLENTAPLLLFFADDGENLELNAVTLYRTFDEVGIFLKKRNLNIGKQPLYGLLKNYSFAQPLLPILSFTQGDRGIAPVFSKDAIVHTSRVKPLGERLIPDTFSKILSPGYETSVARIAALSFQLQDFAEILMLRQEPVIREEGRSFAVSGRKYIETLLKSGAGITKDGNLLLPYDHISVKGNRNAEGDCDLEPMHVKQVFSTQTLANYLLAEKYYVDGAGKQTETVRRLMEFQARIVEELLKDGVPETFRVFIESGTEKITVAVKGQASKITAAKLLLLYPGNSVLKSILNKPVEKLEPEDLLFLSGASEFVPYFKKEIKEVIDRRDSKITGNAAGILGRYLLRQTDGIEDSIDNLLKHWDKDSVLPKSDQVETIERGIIYHHQPLHLLLYLSALQPLSPEAPASFRFERTLNILTYLLETEWGLFGNSVDRLPSAQYLVFKEQPSEYFQAGDLINLRVRLENNCAQGLGSAGYNPSFFIKAWFNPALVYYGTQYVEGLSVLGDFLWRYDGLPAGKVLEYIYQVFVPYEFRSGSVEGGIALRSRMGYEDFGPETASGIICEESGLLAGMKIVPLQEIPGLVFEDRNGNGKKDGNEPGIPNILIKESRGRVLDADTKDRMLRSDAEGRFRIFARDQHEGVQLELRDLPAQYVLMSDPTCLVNRNYSGEIYFPLVPCRTVSGVVIDKDNDTPVEGVLLKLKVNDFEKEVFSGKDGVFVFRNVPLAWEDGLVEIDAKQPFYKGNSQSLKLTFNKPSVINK